MVETAEELIVDSETRHYPYPSMDNNTCENGTAFVKLFRVVGDTPDDDTNKQMFSASLKSQTGDFHGTLFL
ncbi:hypothetical protein C8Q74DRAFT_1374058 [Fomes fomentarius]|nr:hypothetical protein C8Q74DRAFT_1374058 [Fomes fomentarius]